MAGNLVTVATFDEAGQAHIAKNVLEEAGIKVALSDEETVGALWYLSIALGGIKVKVLEEDAERAVAVLEKELGPDEGGEITPEQLAAEAEAATPEEGVEPPPSPTPQTPVGAPSTQADDTTPSERDEYARRLFFIAWFGLAFFPIAFIAFIAFYFFLNAAFGSGPLSPRGRYNLMVGGIVTVAAMTLSAITCFGLIGAFQ
jgi:hypothetical protein